MILAMIHSLLKFDGKADRFEWWATTIITGVVAQIVILSIAFSVFEYGENILIQVALIAIALVAVWILLAVSARRFRDCGFSPWLTLLLIIPIACFVATIICGFIPANSDKKRKLIKRVVQ